MASKEQLFACALANTPASVRFVQLRKNLTGCAYFKLGKLSAPRPVTRRALQVFLHECAHFDLHGAKPHAKPRYLEEYEAEKWSLDKMEEAGIPISLKMRQASAQHVRWSIQKAKRRGARSFDLQALRYAYPGLHTIGRLYDAVLNGVFKPFPCAFCRVLVTRKPGNYRRFRYACGCGSYLCDDADLSEEQHNLNIYQGYYVET